MFNRRIVAVVALGVAIASSLGCAESWDATLRDELNGALESKGARVVGIATTPNHADQLEVRIQVDDAFEVDPVDPYRVLHALAAFDRDRDTLIAFTSDHDTFARNAHYLWDGEEISCGKAISISDFAKHETHFSMYAVGVTRAVIERVSEEAMPVPRMIVSQ